MQRRKVMEVRGGLSGGEGRREERGWSRSEGVGGEHHNNTSRILLTVQTIQWYPQNLCAQYLIVPSEI